METLHLLAKATCMLLPEELLRSLDGLPGFDREAFVAVHQRAESLTSVRINPAKWVPESQSNVDDSTPIQNIHSLFTNSTSPVPWCDAGCYLSERPSFTFDPLFHAGCYYVQEASSMFLEQAFKQLIDLSQPLKVLDLCAAPGGKSTHIQTLLSKDSLLVSNEVIKQRSYVLSDNTIKWGCQNVIVTANDPRAFQKLPGYFDVIVVDAPCSGSGLFRKDAAAIEEWSVNNVALCSQRQQRILGDVLATLKLGGLLIYSTCSYSVEEDEQIADWLVEDMEMENLSLTIDINKWEGIVATASPKMAANGYRFYPDKLKGEGFFLSCFQKRGDETSSRLRPAKGEIVSARERSVIEPWINADVMLLRYRDEIIGLPQNLSADFLLLQQVLTIQYAGTTIGNVLKDKLVPHHSLAQSTLLSGAVASFELNYEEAIKYLQRQELSLQPEIPGWQTVHYKNKPLGWINALKNRINNYYPKEIRILKAQNDSLFEK